MNSGQYAEVNGINLYNIFSSPLFAAATLAFLE
jgi:hypothetical protein